MIQNWLQHLAEKEADHELPTNWSTFDLERFSPEKKLWNYQQTALQLALAVLHRYYEMDVDFHPGERDDCDALRKAAFEEWYREAMHLTSEQRASLDVPLKKDVKRALREMIAEFFPLDEDAPVQDFRHVCNRMNFYMATGSGKTLVLVKLLELLHLLMQRQEIPVCDILVLTHREDLLAQFQRTVDEYNRAPGAVVHIEARELREYPEAKRDAPGGLFGAGATLRVFFYRSDNLRDEHKEAVIDFRNYDNYGRWYVLLDEAHKGEAADAKRKHIVNILSRRGFLFNFSATFVETLDLRTTVFNYNLPAFIGGGFGKHIAVLKQELGAFQRGGEDFTEDEKKKVVVKSLLLLAYTMARVRLVRAESGRADLYHHPMLLALVNSVNTEDADLKLYFRQIRAIARGEVTAKTWKEAKDELWEELREKPEFLYENPRKVEIAREDLMALGPQEVWRDVFNSDTKSDIEVLTRPGNRQEVAFQMKGGGKPFALIKIGDTDGWRKEYLEGFDFSETLETRSFFEDLNKPDSTFNILMGSRSFHEGWDSNRPNVINFVNIGGDNARKFIMQSVGRGVRVQSWEGARRRFEELRDEIEDRELFRRILPLTFAPETLYVLGTNREALDTVLKELQSEKPDQPLLGVERNPRLEEHALLVPFYRRSDLPLIDEREPKKFTLNGGDQDLLSRYDRAVSPMLQLLTHGGSPKQVAHFRKSLDHPAKHYDEAEAREFKNVDVMVQRAKGWFAQHASEVEGIRKVAETDIVHFKKMTVDREHADAIQRKVERVLYSMSPGGVAEKKAIGDQLKQGEFDMDRAAELMDERELKSKQSYKDELTIEYLEEHYYLPMLYVSRGKKLDYLRHIIDVESESIFIGQVIAARKQLAALDWWMFSKIDHTADAISIPYYDDLTPN